MKKDEIKPDIEKIGKESEDVEPIEIVLFQVPECYVYIVSVDGFVSKFDFDSFVFVNGI